MIVWTILIIVVVLVLIGIAIYNSLVRLNVRTDEAWSDIDVQLKRRYDLIPNLVETVKGYAKHEKSTFEMVTEARADSISAKSIPDKAKAENQLEGALKSVFAIAEAYPELKANENFAQLQSDLTDTEDKIQASRRFYNANVRDLNIAIMTFPTSVLAGWFGFKKRDLFELDDAAEKQAVKVDFNK
ncbi:MAG: LemA family protein [Candidatus Berkelbacteria bacterium]|nr:LemA family protein [Candidatus Berkelbacteria bacterium]